MAEAVGQFSEQNPGESEVFSLDFVYDLAPGDAIDPNTPPVWTVGVAKGSDPDPQSHLTGDPQIQGTKALTRIQGLLVDVTYTLTARVVTLAGDTLELWAFLPCVPVGC